MRSIVLVDFADLRYSGGVETTVAMNGWVHLHLDRLLDRNLDKQQHDNLSVVAYNCASDRNALVAPSTLLSGNLAACSCHLSVCGAVASSRPSNGGAL